MRALETLAVAGVCSDFFILLSSTPRTLRHLLMVIDRVEALEPAAIRVWGLALSSLTLVVSREADLETAAVANLREACEGRKTEFTIRRVDAVEDFELAAWKP
jgi:hypothetical protein